MDGSKTHADAAGVWGTVRVIDEEVAAMMASSDRLLLLLLLLLALLMLLWFRFDGEASGDPRSCLSREESTSVKSK
jgi:hypothetical protein